MRFQRAGVLAACLLLAKTTSSHSIKRAPPCTPLAQGWELLDDSPAINQAIANCGNGGTIILQADRTYSIRSPIDFTACKKCDVQIEGQLVVSRGQWDYWNAQPSIFNISSVTGATIRSVSGTGIIDGNARDYYNRGWRTSEGYKGPHLFHVTNSSSNIIVDNLSLRNPPMRFFRLDGDATQLGFSRLKLNVQGQYPLPPVVESETFGFEMGDVSNVTIADIQMEFHTQGNINPGSDKNDRTIGVCVAFDRGTKGITVKNLECRNAWRGVVVMFGTTLSGSIPKLTGAGVSDILVTNLTYSGDFGTGYTNDLSADYLSNITWDGVNILSGGAAVGDRCYLRCHCYTGWYRSCAAGDSTSRLDKIRFRNFRGVLGEKPAPGWGCAANQTECDIQFDGWTPTIV
ncbi:pectin lyase fold/virulence factor [Lophiotrema nucula]|uniref:Pectin lyase fold/virulence factor n=1 Tax=Lophiotrema nucula TaxID=690887 RepID=A0A6A5ZBI5_9PLEO|nr:pectin lyase fold/virulence factor [Lophiotrema nucula]